MGLTPAELDTVDGATVKKWLIFMSAEREAETINLEDERMGMR